MVGWFYINDEVAAPVRMLEAEGESGILTIEVAARFIPNRTMLRGKTIVEYRHWAKRRVVRCLGAERVGQALMIEAVDVGPASAMENQPDDERGAPEDWLAVNGKAYCRVSGLAASDKPDGHCLFHVGLTDWRDLRIGEDAPLASIGITLHADHDNDSSITPLLHSARDLPMAMPPRVEIIRLRERLRLTINLIATDWGDETTLVVAKMSKAEALRRPSKQLTLAAE